MIDLNNNQKERNSELFNNLVDLLVKELLKMKSKKLTDYQIIFNIFNQFQFVETDWRIKELVDSAYYMDQSHINLNYYMNQFNNEFLYSYFLKRYDYEKLNNSELISLATEIITGLFAKKIEAGISENLKSYKPNLDDFEEMVNEVLLCESRFYKSLIKVQGISSYGSYEYGVVQLQLANYKMTLLRILSSDYNWKIKIKSFIQFHFIEKRFRFKSA